MSRVVHVDPSGLSCTTTVSDGVVPDAAVIVSRDCASVPRAQPDTAEPLPVVVRAAEATEGRARLLRKSRGRDRAALRLREGCIRRLGPLVGLPRGATPDALVDAVSARTQRSAPEVHGLLYGAFPGQAPPDDASLVRLADGLDELEREVRRS